MMYALPPSANSLQPSGGHSTLPPMRFRVETLLQFASSLDEALVELEARHPSRRPVADAQRIEQLRRRPR